MRIATAIAQWIVRLTGMTQVVVGLLFWTGRALGLLSLHMALGATFVLALLTLVGLAARAGLPPVLVALAAGYGLVIPVLGMAQTRLWPGPDHWIVRVLHLVLGIGGMILAAKLASRVRECLRDPRRPAVSGASHASLSSENQYS